MARKIALLLLIALLLFLPLLPCHSSPPITPVPVLTCLEVKTCRAIAHFWEVFQGNDYQHVDDIIAELATVQAENPNHATLNFVLGASHLWKFHERDRVKLSAAQVARHAYLAVHYLKIVTQVDPNRRTGQVFLHVAEADVALLEGNRANLKQSFEAIRGDVRKDAAFNGFVKGWVFSALMSEIDPCYYEGIEGYFETFDQCAGFHAPRLFPRLGPVVYAYLELRARRDRVCANTEQAPHNLEGTLLGLGDAFLKHGNLVRARMAYRSVQRAPSYATWPYKREVEYRLANLRPLKEKFRCDSGKLDVHSTAMFFQSAYACTACHAK